jgi:hypothetical protein
VLLLVLESLALVQQPLTLLSQRQVLQLTLLQVLHQVLVSSVQLSSRQLF